MFVRKDKAQDAKKEVAGNSRVAASSAFPGELRAPSARSTAAARLASGSAVAQQQQSAGPGREVLWNPVQAKLEAMELTHRKDRLKQRFHAVNRRSCLFLSLSISLLGVLQWQEALSSQQEKHPDKHLVTPSSSAAAARETPKTPSSSRFALCAPVVVVATCS